MRFIASIIIFNALIALFNLSLPCQAFSDSYKMIHDTDEITLYLHSFTHYEYPNALTMVKTHSKKNNSDRLDVVFILCDEWKIAMVDATEMRPYLHDEEKLKKWPVKPFEFEKGTVGAYLFTSFCSELHRRTPWKKE